MPLTIAIDGPVGAGKSSVSEAVADRLNILHLDTGAMYRALGYQVQCLGGDVDVEAQVVNIMNATEISVSFEDGVQRTLVNGGDVSGLIRTQTVGDAASTVSRYALVRARMVALQQEISQEQDILLDGRDIGTRVLPQATVKIYLTASPQERARRRHAELLLKGEDITYEQVLEQLQARDQQDMNRQVDPLRKAPEAIEVDSTNLSFDQVVRRILDLVEERL